MGKKFDAIVESVVTRFNVGGYIPGVYVKFRPEYKSCACYKAMPSDMKQALDDLIDSGRKIKVTQIGDNYTGPTSGGNYKTADKAVVTVAADMGGGRSLGSITVSADMIDIDTDPNGFPDEYEKDYTQPVKDEVYKIDYGHDSRLTDKGNGKNTPNKPIKESASNLEDIINEALGNDLVEEGLLRRFATKLVGGTKGNPLQHKNRAHTFSKSVAFDVGKDIAKTFGGDYKQHANTVYNFILSYVSKYEQL